MKASFIGHRSFSYNTVKRAARYSRLMAQLEIDPPQSEDTKPAPCAQSALAAGLFGYSLSGGKTRSFKPTEGYLRDIEQMPSFTPPSVRKFVTQYLASNIGKTQSSS
tara:strand:+ start:681 stop:1001 length:321 start_codon:yes stop_codon:yes gene_type:complete